MSSPSASETNGTVANDLEKALQSESSSARLTAILALGKRSGLLSDANLETLSGIMNNDESSNVRLAALDVLKNMEDQSYVKSLITQSIVKQRDPMVQIELLASLSSEEAAKIKEDLMSLTQDPVNIDAVRNQAYAVLLRSNINL